MKKHILGLAFLLGALGAPAPASAGAHDHNRREVALDRKEIRQGKKEIRQDKKEIRQDKTPAGRAITRPAARSPSA